MIVVAVSEFGGRDAAKLVVDSPMVEPVDPFEGGEFEVIKTAPGAFVPDEFGLVEAVDGFGESVVVAVAA